MIRDRSTWISAAECQRHEIFRRHAFKSQLGMHGEAEAAIISRLSQQDAATRTKICEPYQARANQGLPNPCSLPVRMNRQRPQAIPTLKTTINLDRRESDMPGDFPIFFGYESDSEGAKTP